MILQPDSIQFSSRQEIRDLLVILEKFERENPSSKESKTAEKMRDMLEVMEMSW